MAPKLILFVGAIYCWVAVDLYFAGKVGFAVAFVGYAIGNAGLWMASR